MAGSQDGAARKAPEAHLYPSRWPPKARPSTGGRRTPDASRTLPEIQNPADPIARGIGLDRPFFDDKNRAFWILQSIGWTGYFFLRSLSGFANSMGWMFLVHTLLLTAHRLFADPADGVAVPPADQDQADVDAGSVADRRVMLRAFSVIETWSVCDLPEAQLRPVGVEYLGAILLNFSLLAAWAALYYGINYFLLLEEQIDQRERLENQASRRSWRCFATSSTRISCSTR